MVALAVLAMVDVEIAWWLRLFDVALTLVAALGLGLVIRGGFFREEAKATASQVGLAIGGVFFGALSLGFGVLASCAFSDPMGVTSGSRRIAPIHYWAGGSLAIFAVVITGQLSRMLWRRLLDRKKRHVVKAKLLPLSVSEPRRTAPTGYRDGGRAVTLRLDDLTQSLQKAMPGARLQVRGPTLTLKSSDRKSKYFLDVSMKSVGYPETGSADDVKLGSIYIEASDDLIVVQVSHALTSSLGPHLLAFADESLIVDGARSPEVLIADYLTRMNDKLLRGMREIDRLRR